MDGLQWSHDFFWELAMACLLKTPLATTAARKVEAGKSQRDWEQLVIDIGTRWDMGDGEEGAQSIT